jgi:hypothetical protein
MNETRTENREVSLAEWKEAVPNLFRKASFVF